MKHVIREATRIHYDPSKNFISVTDKELGRKVDYPVSEVLLDIQDEKLYATFEHGRRRQMTFWKAI